MSNTIKLTRESSGKCYAYITESNERVLTEGQLPIYTDPSTSYSISQVSGIGYIYKTNWLQFFGITVPHKRKWLQEGSTRNYP